MSVDQRQTYAFREPQAHVLGTLKAYHVSPEHDACLCPNQQTSMGQIQQYPLGMGDGPSMNEESYLVSMGSYGSTRLLACCDTRTISWQALI